MKKYDYTTLDESLYHQKLENGLEIYLIPKPHYVMTTAYFATPFGSIHTGVDVGSKDNPILLPTGVAHFIEHRIFDNEDGPVIDRFAALGASCNAFTSFNKTAYYFKTEKNLMSCLTLLLDFVQKFKVKSESVEREKDIICEEIKMYQDSIPTMLLQKNLEQLLKVHPCRDDIGGSIEDVQSTTKEILQAAYTRFYHPEKMVLVIAGKLDVEKVIAHIEENQRHKFFPPFIPFPKRNIVEPMEINIPSLTTVDNVKVNKLAYGVKFPPLTYRTTTEHSKISFKYSILFDMIFSNSGPFYEKWVKQKIITNQFSVNAFEGDQYNLIIIIAEVLKSTLLEKQLKTIFSNLAVHLPAKKDFLRVKKALAGHFMRSLNRLDSITHDFLDELLDHKDYFNSLQIIQSITYEEIIELAISLSNYKSAIHYIIGKESHD